MRTRKLRAIHVLFLAAACALGVPPADAHEGAARNEAAAPARKEQKPWGIAGDAKSAMRTIEIAMSDDMKFTPSSIDVKLGDTVKFVIRNKGQLLHEMVIGDRKTLEEHAALMVRFPKMEHDEPYMAHVSPGKEGSLVWTFNRAGAFEFACLIAGHYQAGMAGKIRVAQAQTVPASPPAPSKAASIDMIDAEVRKVDKEQQKITLKHGEIKSLDMPPMTMVFGVKDAALLDQVKAGDKVRFRAVDEGGGKLTIVEMQGAK